MITLPEVSDILLFAFSSLILVILPGPAFIYIITKTNQQGKKAGLYSILGIETGTLLHVFAIAFGFSILLMNSDSAFMIVKYGGILYLVYLGVKNIYKNIKPDLILIIKPNYSTKRAYFDGVILGTLNIKTLLFLSAFIPQFISNSKGNPSSQILFLGLCFIIIALIWGVIMVSFLSKLKKSLNISFISQNLQNRITGIIYILLGLVSLTL